MVGRPTLSGADASVTSVTSAVAPCRPATLTAATLMVYVDESANAVKSVTHAWSPSTWSAAERLLTKLTVIDDGFATKLAETLSRAVIHNM